MWPPPPLFANFKLAVREQQNPRLIQALNRLSLRCSCAVQLCATLEGEPGLHMPKQLCGSELCLTWLQEPVPWD